MANEIVMVPTFARNELLWLCLEAIRLQDAKVKIVVFSDRGHEGAELAETCSKFDAHWMVRRKTIGFGNSFNVIEGLRFCSAFGTVDDIVHAIEDDTIIHPGYLAWARAHLASGNYAVALGRIPGDTLSTWYESPCASWNVGCLSLCLEKLPIGYFADTREEMQKVVDAAFPHSKFQFGSAEQDGFFLRCLEFFKWKTAYPPHSFASHIGAWGYNRPTDKGPDGTFEERVAYCRALLYDKQRRTELFGQAITEREMEGMRHG